MRAQSLLAILVLGVLVACGSGEDKSAADTVSTDPNAESSDAEATRNAGEAAADSIPMSVTITLPTVAEPAGTIHGGTFNSAGKGPRCEHLEGGGPHEWAVIYPGNDSNPLEIGSVQLNVGKLTGGRTSSFHVTAVAGSIEGKGGPNMPLTHNISTIQSGAVIGSGSETVTREGQRVRFEVDGISGTTKRSFRMTLVCEREGKWV